jgi:tRNA threonylcarbamoyladenosine biosynthesis protein TsaB
MAIILSIETATSVCSVAVHDSGVLRSLCETNQKSAHAERLMVLIIDCLTDAGLQINQLDAIAVSEGPGSYTGLRIGVSTAKGLAYGLDKPLISINTLQALACAVSAKEGELIVPVLDARRMEVYREVFDWKLITVSKLDAENLEVGVFQNFLENGRVYFLGDAVEKVKSVVSGENATFRSDVSFSASHMGKLALEKFRKAEFADLAYFVPNYLKEFKALHAKKNPLLSL